jgi:tRNA nucleotidyltransferase (CCA-adding enzyme)
MESILKEYEFDIMRRSEYTDENKLSCVLLEMKNSTLPSIEKKTGPHMSDSDGSRNFIKKYEKLAKTGPFIEGGFWVVETERKFTTAERKIKDSLDDPLKELKAKGIPSHIAEEISKKYSVFSKPEQIIQISKKDKDFGVFLREYFEKERLVA